MYHIQETTYTRELYHMYVPYTRDYVHTRVISSSECFINDFVILLMQILHKKM